MARQAPRKRKSKAKLESAVKKPIKVSRLGFYIIIFGWLTICVNLLLSLEWTDQDTLINQLVSTDPEVMVFRGLLLLLPLLFTILGFLVYQREKVLWRAVSEGRRLESEKLSLQVSYSKLAGQRKSKRDKELGTGGRLVHLQAKGGIGMVASFMEHQAKKSREQSVVDILKEDGRRLRALSILHESLAKADDYYVANGASLVRAICGDLAETLGRGRKIKFNLDVDAVSLGPETAVFVSILLSELVSNSLRFAFADITSPEIRVHLSEAGDGKALLKVSDNGHGMPEGLDVNYLDTLGLKIVSQMTKQLDGMMETSSSSSGGTTVSVKFPLNPE